MKTQKITWNKVNQWKNTVLYQVSNGRLSANVEVETIRDKARGFKRVCSSFGDFEADNMAEVKLSINLQFNNN